MATNRTQLAALTAIVGGATSLWAGVMALLTVGVVSQVMGLSSAGVGGIGAVSFGVAEGLVELLALAIPAFLVSRASRVAGAVKRRGLLRGYWISSGILLLLSLAGPVILIAGGSLLVMLSLALAMPGLLFALQSVAGFWATFVLVRHFLEQKAE